MISTYLYIRTHKVPHDGEKHDVGQNASRADDAKHVGEHRCDEAVRPVYPIYPLHEGHAHSGREDVLGAPRGHLAENECQRV